MPVIKVVPHACVTDLVLNPSCVSHALDETDHEYIENKVRLAMARGLRAGNTTDDEVDSKLKYHELYYNSTWSPGEDEIFPALTELDMAFSRRSLFLLIDDELHEFKNIQMLQKQHRMATNSGTCNHMKSV